MKCLVILVISVIISLVATDGSGGEYVPKAFYFLDANGRPSIPQPITQETLNRVRRQVGFNNNFGGFAFPQPVFNIPQIQPGGQSSFVSSSQTLASRFGEDEPIVTGQTQTFHSSGGQFQQTVTNLRPDGTVTTNKQSGRVKRDMSQTQSQGSEDGKTQFQSQSQTMPGGVQIQSQQQPGMSQTQSQGADLTAKGSFDHIQEPEQQQQPLNSDIPRDRAQSGAPLPPPPSQQQQQQQPQRPPPPPPPPQQQQPNYPQGQYPQGQPSYPGQQFPFGFGQFGFPSQAGFGFPQSNFGFPQAGFGFPQAGFGFPQQPGFGGGPPPPPPPQGAQTGFVSSVGSLDNRFGEDEVPGVVTGGTQTVTSQNGNYQITSSVLRPDGQVVTTQQSGRHYQG